MSKKEIPQTDHWKGNILMYVYTPLMIMPIILVFVFYNYYGLNLLVYTGLLLLAGGIALNFLAGHEFQRKGGVPEGEHLIHTTRLVDSGIYAVVRHPQYLGFILIVLSLVLISQHWLSVISGVIGSILFYIDVKTEEQSNIEKFGDDYTRYMQRVPRMNALVGVMRRLQHQRE